ncbi:methyltransferase [Sulfurospirillum arcachonense]|uniref:methyltransferase n=1 Tax=Sulfurospirillum arcachonense TaxID=57666 RepID=UPI0004692164|nr:methyltransferase [Sulfurospirillum arcachonense]
MNNLFRKNDSKSALEAQYEAQKIAFAPIIFQVTKSMRDFGILEILQKNDKMGISLKELTKKIDLSEYAIKTLLETSLSADIVKVNNDKYRITKTGYFLQNDTMTKINMNYNHYVNYEGLFHLEESLKQEAPIGLYKTFGDDSSTIYPKLSTLPQKAKKSWFEFDHYYSDTALNEAVDILLDMKPNTILDIGGNTGKFSMNIAKKNKKIKITIADLPEQVSLAKPNIAKNSLENQIDFFPTNILDHQLSLPKNYDIVWMSQFLDCFREEDIIAILKRAREAINTNGKVCIMEPLWDKQRFETSSFCIINTSPYFTALANGYSKMFNATDMQNYIEKAGLKIVNQMDNIGICQSIIICK